MTMNKLLSGRRFLVVEDEILILMMIEGMLADLGCKSVTAATRNEQAIALIEGQVFDAAMLDMNLNGKSSLNLADALAAHRIAGAALDCFSIEPLTTPPVFAQFDNVLLAPHCIAWTDELFRDIGRAACQGMLDLVAGNRPRGIVNPGVLERPGFLAKWKRVCEK